MTTFILLSIAAFIAAGALVALIIWVAVKIERLREGGKEETK